MANLPAGAQQHVVDGCAQSQHSRPSKRSAATMESDDTQPTQSPQELELSRLERAYEAAQLERRTLLRQIQEMLNEGSASSSISRAILSMESLQQDQQSTSAQLNITASASAAEADSTSASPTSSRATAEPAAAAAPSHADAHMTPAQEAAVGAAAQDVIQQHIRLLARYNEMRDIGQGLIGLVAEQRRVRVRDCQEEFGVAEGD